jgi:hypothetical protein
MSGIRREHCALHFRVHRRQGVVEYAAFHRQLHSAPDNVLENKSLKKAERSSEFLVYRPADSIMNRRYLDSIIEIEMRGPTA